MLFDYTSATFIVARRFIYTLASFGILSSSLLIANPDVRLTKSIAASMQRGADFLVEDQNANGSWGSATQTKMINIYAPLPGAHHAYRAGATGLALSGLLDIADSRPNVQAAIDKCEVWSIENLPKLRRADQTTTYNIWGHAYGLRSLIRLHERAFAPKKKSLLRELAQEQVDLVNRYEDLNGGWGYLDVFDGFTSREAYWNYYLVHFRHSSYRSKGWRKTTRTNYGPQSSKNIFRLHRKATISR